MSYDITEILQEIEEELMKSMCRNLSRHINEEQDAQANYPQWQTKQLQALEKYRKENFEKFSKQFDSINDSLRKYLEMTYNNAKTKTEYDIMKALSENIAPTGAIGVNQEKLNALINAITDDFQKAEHSILRRSNDLYRQTIFKAQIGLNTGSMTLNQAIDMATKDFLANGINSIRYKNGNLVNIASYSEMALRTAEKRATAYGEGEKRQEWDINTVVVYGHNGACPLCSKWQNRVYIDDVWSGGKPNGKYPLLSEAIRGGLYHPNCKDLTPQTYIEGITEPPTSNTKEEIQKNVENYNLEQTQRYNERQIRKYKRLEANSLDPTNKQKYALKVQQWQSKQRELINTHPEQLRRDYSREKVRVLNITEPPENATKVTPIVQNGLTFLNVDGILNVDGTSNNFNKSSNKNKPSNNVISKNDDNPYGFNKIIGEHSRDEDLQNTNPKGDTNNCVLCCVAYEGRRRNFDVVAKSKDPNLSNVKKSGWRSAFKNSIAEDCSGTSSFEVYQNISNKMNEWYAKNQNKGTVRAVIMVHWKGTNLSHAFIVEKDENGIIFLDPQTNEKHVDYYIYDDNMDLNLPLIVRIDNLEFTDNISKCCENRSELK